VKNSIITLFLLAGCHPAPHVQHPVRVDVPWVVRQPARKVAEDNGGDDLGGTNPIQAIKGAAEVKDKAKEYVLDPHSDAVSIDQLTILSRELDAARKRMDETKAKTGKYDRSDVIALSKVRKAMQDFIQQVNGH